MGGNVHEIQSEEEWEQYLSKSSMEGKAMIVDFTASWCGPCQRIKPIYEALSAEFTNIIFVKVDVDALDTVAAKCGVSAMPTFQVFKDGEKVDEMTGANEAKLKEICTKYA